MELVVEFEKQFPRGPTIAATLRWAIEGWGVLVLFGPSGSGKTTVVRVVAGLERPERGRVQFGDEVWLDTAAGLCWSPQQRRVGLVAQDYALFPHLTVFDNVAYGLRGLDRVERNRRVDELLALVGLTGAARRYPRQLSGGEQQRVALARAVAPRPRLLLLDEPLAALDAPERERLRNELRRLLHRLDLPTVVITHDRLEALALGDVMAVMMDGHIRQMGLVPDVFNRPADLAVARLLGVETLVAARPVGWRDGLLVLAAGSTQLIARPPESPNAVPVPGLPNDVTETTEFYAAIRAEDVLITRQPIPAGSARNQWSGRIVAVSPEGPMVRVQIDCGFPLTALLTRQAWDELALKLGDPVVALVKAPAVHLIPHRWSDA